ncbi:MAG TPA: hypothetical protein DIC57_06285, partial [Sphaerochaeta sp.]|nr:hypothetical protein [Sphaerochaeta sp.]
HPAFDRGADARAEGVVGLTVVGGPSRSCRAPELLPSYLYADVVHNCCSFQGKIGFAHPNLPV